MTAKHFVFLVYVSKNIVDFIGVYN